MVYSFGVTVWLAVAGMARSECGTICLLFPYLLINNFVNTQRANWTYPSNTLRPYRIEAEEGLTMFKLRCRKFVELILQAVGIDNEAKIACASGRQRQ